MVKPRPLVAISHRLSSVSCGYSPSNYYTKNKSHKEQHHWMDLQPIADNSQRIVQHVLFSAAAPGLARYLIVLAPFPISWDRRQTVEILILIMCWTRARCCLFAASTFTPIQNIAAPNDKPRTIGPKALRTIPLINSLIILPELL